MAEQLPTTEISASYECKDCNMTFDTRQEYLNHKQKFCIASDYGTTIKLDQKFESIQKTKAQGDPSVNLQAISSYLKSAQASVIDKNLYGNMSLEELRQYFHNDQQKFKELQERADKKRSGEVTSEIEALKKERQMVKLTQAKDEQELTEVLQELDKKKEKELRAKIEKDRIAAELQGIERAKLSYLEEEKKRELERLAMEREMLKQKEDEIMKDINGLKTQMQEKEAALKADKLELAKKRGKGKEEILREEIKQKEMEFAKERGEKVAALKQRRELLERERQRILSDVEALKTGDMTRISKKGIETILPPISEGLDDKAKGLGEEQKKKLIEGEARLNELRENIKKSEKEMLPEISEFDVMQEQFKNADMKASTADYVKKLEEANAGDKKALAEKLSIVRTHLDKEIRPGMLAAHGNSNAALGPTPGELTKPREYRKPNPVGKLAFPHSMNPPQRIGLSSVIRPSGPMLHNPTRPKGSIVMPQKPKPVEEEKATPSMPPAPAAPPNSNYGSSVAPAAPPTMPYYPMAGPYQSAYNPVSQPYSAFALNAPPTTDPLLIQNLSEIKDKIAKTLEKNQELATELKMLKAKEEEKKETPEEDAPEEKPKQSAKHPTKPAIDLPAPPNSVFAQNEERPDDLEAEEKAMLNLAAQEYDSLQLLSKLDPASDLYKYKLQQYKEMSEYRKEIEKALQKQRLDRLKFDFSMDKKKIFPSEDPEATATLDDEPAAIEQAKRAVITNRLKKEYQEQLKGEEPPPEVYDPATGLTLHFDYALGLPADVVKLQPVYEVFAGGNPLSDPQQVGPLPARFDRDKSNCIMATRTTLKDVPGLPEGLLVVELQGINKNGTVMNLGWTCVDLFDSANRLKAGLHKLPIMKPPTQTQIDPENLRGLMKQQNEELYLRVSHAQGDYVKAVNSHPSNKNLYTVPDILTGISPDPDAAPNEQQVMMVDPGAPPQRTPSMPSRDSALRVGPAVPIPQSRSGDYPKPSSNNKMYPPPVPIASNRPPALVPAKTPDKVPIGKPLSNKGKGVDPKSANMRGVNCKLHEIRNMAISRPFKLSVGILEGKETYVQKNTQDFACAEFDLPSPQPGLVPTSGGKPISGVNKPIQPKAYAVTVRGDPKAGEEAKVVPRIPINKECEFQGNIYEENKSKFPHPEHTLIVKILEKPLIDRTVLLPGSDQPQKENLIGYSFLPLEQENDAINFGFHQLPIYPPDMYYPFTFEKDPIPNAMLHLTLDDYKGILPKNTNPPQAIAMEPNEPQANLSNPQQILRIQNQPDYVPPEQSKRAVLLGKEDYSLHFIPNELPLSGVEFSPADSVVIYVDQLRFIPEKCGPVKIRMRGYYINLERCCKDEQVYLAELNSSVCMQDFRVKHTMAFQNFNPTAIMVASLEVFDFAIGYDRRLGYIALNLFLDSKTHQPCIDIVSPNFSLMEGDFQVPIYCEDILTTKCTMEYIGQFDTVPGSSALSQLKKSCSSWRKEPLPKVKALSIIKAAVFLPAGNKANQIKYRSVIKRWRASEGQSQEIRDRESKAWLENFMRAVPNAPLFDICYYDLYQPTAGIKIKVDGFHNCPTHLPLVTLCSINRPAKYYATPQESERTFLFHILDFNSPQRSMRYAQDWQPILGQEPRENTQLILDIRSIECSKDETKLVQWGWTVLPLFDYSHNGVYVNSGIHMLPVFSGQVPASHLPELAKAQNVQQFLHDLRSQLPHIQYIEPMSIIVRVKDARFSTVYNAPYQYKRFKKSALPKGSLEKYDFNIKTAARVEKLSKLAGLVPFDENKEYFQKKITEGAIRKLGLMNIE